MVNCPHQSFNEEMLEISFSQPREHLTRNINDTEKANNGKIHQAMFVLSWENQN